MKNYKNMPCVNIKLNVNGFETEARYFQEDIGKIFLPLIKTLSDILFDIKIKKAGQGMLIVYLAAPPGAGKTTLALFLSRLSETEKEAVRIQSVGIDGFHYPQEYIEKHSIIINGETIPMRNIKGSPETYDLQKLTDKIKLLHDNKKNKNIKFPVYDRNLHDVIQDAVLIREDIVIIEGNWLLLDEPGWRELISFCDYSIFIYAEENMLKERLIQRKISGGASPEDAEKFYDQSDSVNIKRAILKRLKSDCELTLNKYGKFSIK